jgi:DNA-binding XRE family transcriptional regulator
MKLKRTWLKPESLKLRSRNPRPSRQSKTVDGNSLVKSTWDISEMREAVGMTQKELAKALGVRRSMIANLEAGRYVASVFLGITMYLVFAKIAADKQLTSLCTDAKENVRRFIAFQRRIDDELIRDKEREVEATRAHAALREKHLAEQEARLREL